LIDEISLSPAPPEEWCAQLGQPGYDDETRREIRPLIGQLQRQRQLGPTPFGAEFQVGGAPGVGDRRRAGRNAFRLRVERGGGAGNPSADKM